MSFLDPYCFIKFVEYSRAERRNSWPMQITQDATIDFRGHPALSSKTGKWKGCAFLVGYEAFERKAFYGVASNLVNYLTSQIFVFGIRRNVKVMEHGSPLLYYYCMFTKD